jgi:hypothetical protein
VWPRTIAALAVAAAPLFTALPARSDLALPTTVREDYASSVKVSGGILVGLVIGPLSGVADPHAVRVPLGLFVKPTLVCIAAKTRDGQYWSEATFTAPGHATGYGFMLPQTPWRFITELKRYQRADYAVLARYGPDCNIDPAAPYLPVRYEGPALQLTAALNLPRAISWNARLAVAGGSTVPGQCAEAPSNVRATAYNIVCTFDLSGVSHDPSTADLVLDRRERTGERTDSFVIRLVP